MAEQNQSTDIAVSDGGPDTAMMATSEMDTDVQNPDLDEQSSSKFDMAVGDLDLLR